MAKSVESSETAIRDRYEIYVFWLKKTKEERYSEKLETLFKSSAQVMAEFPELGVLTDIPNLRLKIVRGYKIFYIVTELKIQIVRVWDSRRDPDSINFQ